MIKLHKIKLGAALLVSTAFSSVDIVLAQTCTVPPTCESLGYDRTAGECSDAVKSLRCPLDKDKVFCLTAAEIEEIVGGTPGTKVAEIGDIVYTDTISAEPIPGRVPVGIVYDISGKMVSIAEYGREPGTNTGCEKHVADGIDNWEKAKQEDMGSIKAHLTKINVALAKISTETPKIGNSDQYHDNCYRTSDGRGAACMYPNLSISSESGECKYCASYQDFPLTRCVRKFGPNGANDVGNTAPVTTYKVGDAYKDNDGNVIGTVVAITNGGKSGTIAYAEGSGTSSDASVKCSQKTTGGKAWTLASGAHACTLLKTAGSSAYGCGSSMTETFTCGIHSADGLAICINSKACTNKNKSSWQSFGCTVNDTLTYVCTASF